MSFIEELKRRNVFKVGIAYLVGSWILIQVADILFENIGTPGWVMQTMLVFLGLGFFVALFFAWAFEMTPEGIKREADVDRSQSITNQTGKKLNSALVVMLALAIGYILFDKISGPEPVSTPAVDTAASDSTLDTQPAADSGPVISQQSIAVLPFDNRSPDANDAYFTEGIHDDLLTNLARIGSLKVISRTSVTQYKDTEKTIPQIAAELGVAHIMEGAVQRSGNQVRINVQLIDAQTDEHLWAEIFDRELTANNLFAIQSEISQAIADALETTLSADEQQGINTVPTQNLLAYEAYLRGKQLQATREAASMEQGLAEFEKAVELDPQFALAWLGIGDSLVLLTSYGTYPGKESYERAGEAVDRALAINNRLGEAYASLALILTIKNEWALAEAAHIKSIELSPNYATAYHWYSNDLNNFPLRVDESIELALKAHELDPYSPVINANLAGSYSSKGLYSMAERQEKRLIELHPKLSIGYAGLGNLYAYSLGQFAKAISNYEKAVELSPGNIFQKTSLVEIYLEVGDFEKVAEIQAEISDLSPDHLAAAYSDVMVNLYKSNVSATSEAINYALPKAQGIPGLVNLLATIKASQGDLQGARDIYLANQPGWLVPEQWTELINGFSRDACLVPWVLIQTGDDQLGRKLLEQASRFIEEDLPAMMEHADTYLPGICQAARGDFEKTLTSLETILNHNHLLNWKVTLGLPLFDPIRDDPRFDVIEQEYERKIAIQRSEIEAMRSVAGP
jgi:TolB-like protein